MQSIIIEHNITVFNEDYHDFNFSAILQWVQ
jgi:hypothetical protein